MKNKINILIAFGLFLILIMGCVEKYNITSDSYEPYLVVEALLTNEMKKHTVKLTRIMPLDSMSQIKIGNAQVKIESSNGDIYQFSEIRPGEYQSNTLFKAVPNLEYQLFIKTVDNKTYQSTKETLPKKVEISEVKHELKTVNGNNGIQIFASSEENSDNTFFKYNYEVTYKVVTPYLITEEIHIFNVDLFDFPPCVSGCLTYDMEMLPPTDAVHICYSKEETKKIDLVTLDSFGSDNVQNHPILFINEDEFYKIRERYSILVKQYSLSENTYNFYKILRDLGDITTVFSEKQKGFINGNISSSTHHTDVVGLFEVSSVSKVRKYFNYEDFGLIEPHYQFDCQIYELDYFETGCSLCNPPTNDERTLIYQYVTQNSGLEVLRIHSSYDNVGQEQLLVDFVTPECSNCKTFSSEIRPDFWQD